MLFSLVAAYSWNISHHDFLGVREHASRAAR